MKKKYLLDTNILIDLINKKEKVVDFLEGIEPKECEISVVSTAEFFLGIYRSENPGKQIEWYDGFIRGGEMEVLEIGETAAKQFAKLQVEYIKKGKVRPIFDLLLAATAMTHNLILVTQDKKHFEGIEGLRLR